MAPIQRNRPVGQPHVPATEFFIVAADPDGHLDGESRSNRPKVPPKSTRVASTEMRAYEPIVAADSSPLPSSKGRPPGRSWEKVAYASKWFAVTVVVGAIISIPMIVTRQTVNIDESGSNEDVLQRYFQSQYQNLVFWLFGWLLTTWIAACLFHLVAQFFPHCFRAVAIYINPAHRRYWRVFRAMKWPITLLGAAVGSYVAFAVLIYYNDDLTVNYSFDTLNNVTSSNNSDSGNGHSTSGQNNGTKFDDSAKQVVYQVQDILDDVLFNVILWVCLYFLEKCIIVYISVHFHYRSNFKKIKDTKQILTALATLFEASLYLQPLHTETLRREDYIIHQSQEPGNGKLSPATNVSRFLGTSGKGLTSALGHLVGSENTSHWFQPTSSYAVVSRALDHPTSAAALAKRIWISLTCDGQIALTASDITAVLGSGRRQEAQEIFALLDENGNGDIRLSELISAVVGIGALRRNIYAGMHDIDHVLNTFDWVLCLILVVAMVFFILVSWVPQIKMLRDNLALIVVGGAFIVGRIGHEFFSGAIFVLFKHAFDVADHVKLYNVAETQVVSCIVKRISLLYVVFERVEDGMTMQIPNDKLNAKRIENVTRSGINRESIDIYVDFKTTFKDIELLRNELSQFISHQENSRDYQPRVDVRITSIGDMSKLLLSCSFWHKSNWSNEELRAARSSRFLCALLAAIRKVPISKPGGSSAKTGDEGKPSYTVTITEEEAAKKRGEEKKKQAEKRMDYVELDSNPGPTTLPPTNSTVAETHAASGEPHVKQETVNTRPKEEKIETDAAAAAAAAAAAKKAKKDEEDRVEQEAYRKFSEVPPEAESHTSRAVGSTFPLQQACSEAFSIVSGRERGIRRMAMEPGQNTPFYTPWN